MPQLERALALIALISPIVPAVPAMQAPLIAATAQQDTTAIDLAHLDSPERIERQLRRSFDTTTVAGVTAKLSIRNGTIHPGYFTIEAGDTATDNILVVYGNADIHGVLTGNLVVLDGNAAVHPDGSVSGDILVLNGKVDNAEGRIGGTVQAFGEPLQRRTSLRRSTTSFLLCHLTAVVGLMAVVGTFLVLLVFGLGLTVFARSKLLVVADTVAHSFGRSFIVGFIGQSMILPTFGIMVVGLELSVVGILLLPFVVVAYIVLVVTGLVGGYVAVAHIAGQRYRRQRRPADAPAPPDSFRTVVFGLGILVAPWIALALLGWVPFFGALFWALTFSATWVLVTAGFGAILLSRGGTRTHFAGGSR